MLSGYFLPAPANVIRNGPHHSFSLLYYLLLKNGNSAAYRQCFPEPLCCSWYYLVQRELRHYNVQSQSQPKGAGKFSRPESRTTCTEPTRDLAKAEARPEARAQIPKLKPVVLTVESQVEAKIHNKGQTLVGIGIREKDKDEEAIKAALGEM